MSTKQHDLAKLYQHSDDCQERQIEIRSVHGVLEHLIIFVDDLIPTGSVEQLELRNLARQLDLANQTCRRIRELNEEYYLEDTKAAQALEIEDPARQDQELPF